MGAPPKGLKKVKKAITGEGPAEHLWLEWHAPEGSDQRANGTEAVDALFALVDGWMEILALEVRLGCYDRDIYTEALDQRLPRPHHRVVLEPRPAEVSVEPMFRAIETPVAAINRAATHAWLEENLAQPCGDRDRFEPSLRNIYILASLTALPPDWSDRETLALECSSGSATIPVRHHAGNDWIAAPPSRPVVHQPVVISLASDDDALNLTIEVYWSPWVGQLAIPESPISCGVARLEERGWYRAAS